LPPALNEKSGVSDIWRLLIVIAITGMEFISIPAANMIIATPETIPGSIWPHVKELTFLPDFP